MNRAPLSVVLVVPDTGSARTAAPRARDALRPSLGVSDEVVVVRAADVSAGRLEGVRRAKHDLVLLVCADAIPGVHAVDALVASLGDDTAAVAPVHDAGHGRQAVAAPATALVPGAFRAWSREWRSRAGRKDSRGDAWDADALADTILLARRDVLLADGCSPGVGARLRTQGRLLVVPQVVWHHPGGAACPVVPAHRPLLAAALIVKDEEELLSGCLESLRGVCDEVVVYDTGSTDRTVEIARAAGARVVEGYWDDDFGGARNRCLAHVTAEWFLHIDADEVLSVADVAAFHALLRRTDRDALLVDLENLTLGGFGSDVVAALLRLGRRDRTRYDGRLHEQIRRLSEDAQASELVPGVRLVHSGYLDARMLERGKGTRNARIAALALEEGASGAARGTAYANLVRSLKLAGDDRGALEQADASLDHEGTGQSRREIAATAIMCALAVADGAAARGWLERYRAATRCRSRVKEKEARVLLTEHRFEEALAAVCEVRDGDRDEEGKVVVRQDSLLVELEALHRLGRTEEAARAMLSVASAPTLSVPLVLALRALRPVEGALEAWAAALPESLLLATLAEAKGLHPDDCDTVCEALWGSGRRPAAILAVVESFASRLQVLRALEWSIRAAGAVSGASLPLHALAHDPRRTPRDRVVAAALLLEGFGDRTALPAFLAAAADVPDEDAAAVTAELRLVAPRTAAELLAA